MVRIVAAVYLFVACISLSLSCPRCHCQDETEGHPCKRVSPRVSGTYTVLYEGRYIEVFCEFRADHGYIFVPTQVLRENPNLNVKSLYEDKSNPLIKFKYQGKQYDAEIGVKFRLGIQNSEHFGYQGPSRGVTAPYFFLGITPETRIQKGNMQGYNVNGFDYSFENCDGNPNSYFVFFLDENMTDDANPDAGNYGIRPWFTHKVLAAASIPDRYFYTWDMHHGGCGVYHRTTGGALGIRFSL